ncbi:hypothetical protein [Nonomuraea diastatica]|uniref:Uncharacterized protein n=1 Tax=Nonomuraea diastatica TaxID=1848329 RepID=A0A4R4WKM6_9ACTN|nr:hypothetical protein [Nonomuraea diastatica]TDD14250.1 hypothetical protein E1294_38215 [Nonomuraea diastatica]
MEDKPVPVRGRWPLAVLRVTASAHAVAVFGQAVFAGRYLSGDYDMLGVHATVADVVTSVGLAQLACAVVLWWRGGVRWPTWVSLLLVLGEIGQYLAGQASALDLHVPLGVVLAILTTVLLVALWRPQPVAVAA